jgi:hypothetical protein
VCDKEKEQERDKYLVQEIEERVHFIEEILSALCDLLLSTENGFALLLALLETNEPNSE